MRALVHLSLRGQSRRCSAAAIVWAPLPHAASSAEDDAAPGTADAAGFRPAVVPPPRRRPGAAGGPCLIQPSRRLIGARRRYRKAGPAGAGRRDRVGTEPDRLCAVRRSDCARGPLGQGRAVARDGDRPARRDARAGAAQSIGAGLLRPSRPQPPPTQPPAAADHGRRRANPQRPATPAPSPAARGCMRWSRRPRRRRRSARRAWRPTLLGRPARIGPAQIRYVVLKPGQTPP